VPVKRYSSGMYARLGFAVAAHVQPEILLVDEVLAVGDTAFQFKCLSKIRQMVDEAGCTVVFISHNMDTVQGLCERVIWLDRGVIQDDGRSEQVIEAYLIHEEKRQLDGSIREVVSGPLQIDTVTLHNGQNLATAEFASEEDIVVDLHYVARQPITRPVFSVGIRDPGSSLICLATMLIDGAAPERLADSGIVRCHFSGIAPHAKGLSNLGIGAR
jgi:ABC-type multidrug transport system ATPase subunit